MQWHIFSRVACMYNHFSHWFFFFLTWMMFDIVELRIKLLNYIRSVLNGPLGYMTLPFPETKLAHKHKQIIWNISSSYSMDCALTLYIYFPLWKHPWLLKQEYFMRAHIYTPCSCWQVYVPPPRFLLGWWFWCSLPAKCHPCIVNAGNALKREFFGKRSATIICNKMADCFFFFIASILCILKNTNEIFYTFWIIV